MRILVGVNDTPAAEGALHWAVAEGRTRGVEVLAIMAAGVPLAAYPLGWPSSSVDADAIVGAYRRSLDDIIDRVVGEDGFVERHVRVGGAAEVLLDEAEDVDLVVVGTRELHGLFRWLGSVSDQIVRHAACPAVLVPDAPAAVSTGAPVVVGVDGSDNSKAAVRWALEEARHREVGLQAVAVWGFLDQPQAEAEHFDPRYGEGSARDFLTRMVEEAVGPAEAEAIELVTVCDLPSRGLVEAAEASHTPLLVIGARGVGGFKGLLLGSVAHKVLGTVNRPVAVVRHRA
jgi:nucleotide-binding universal stress UspA family protein